jgi:hypothetical protein
MEIAQSPLSIFSIDKNINFAQFWASIDAMPRLSISYEALYPAFSSRMRIRRHASATLQKDA